MELNNNEYLLIKNFIIIFEKYNVNYNYETLKTCIDVFCETICDDEFFYQLFENENELKNEIKLFVIDTIKQKILSINI